MTVSNNTNYTPKAVVAGAAISTVMASPDIVKGLGSNTYTKYKTFSDKRQFLNGVISSLESDTLKKLKKTTVSKMIKTSQKNIFKQAITTIGVGTLAISALGVIVDIVKNKSLQKPSNK